MGKITVIDGHKVCKKCGVNKDKDLFGLCYDPRYNKKYIKSRCKECEKTATYKWRKDNVMANKMIDRRYNDKLKETILSHYGRDGKAVCIWCGFGDIKALCLDHINDNGAEERRSMGSKFFAGKIFYQHLIKNNYPLGYQTLCANCNLIKECNRRRNGNNNPPQL